MKPERELKRKELKRYRKANGIKKRRASTRDQGSKPWTAPLIGAKQSPPV